MFCIRFLFTDIQAFKSFQPPSVFVRDIGIQHSLSYTKKNLTRPYHKFQLPIMEDNNEPNFISYVEYPGSLWLLPQPHPLRRQNLCESSQARL